MGLSSLESVYPGVELFIPRGLSWLEHRRFPIVRLLGLQDRRLRVGRH